MKSTQPLDPHLRRRVRRVMADSHGPHVQALCDAAAGSRKAWTPADWQLVLNALDACDDRVEAWLALRQ